MKNAFEEAKVKVIRLAANDVITMSVTGDIAAGDGNSNNDNDLDG